MDPRLLNRGEASTSLPERVGRYDVLLPIASGGMATVYLARSRGVGGFERDVALKLTHAHLRQASGFAADLVEEAKLAAQIRHPNVVSVLDVGEDPAGLFLTMEYVEGDTLASLIRKSAAAGLPLGIGLRVLLDALAGLHAAHELRGPNSASLGLVHRDFSPQNILVGLDGVARLADFGIAKAMSRVDHTQTGFIKGKIAYMAPEQARGLRIDRRCDVWAAGVIAWEILAGRRLRDSENDAVTLLAVVTEEPPALSSVRSDIPGTLALVVARALRMDPEARWPDAAILSRELVAACRSGDVRIADSIEVAEHVRALVGSKIGERRARVAEIAELRAEVGRIASIAHEAALPTPSSRAQPAVDVEAPTELAPAVPPVGSAEPARTEDTPISTPVATRISVPTPAPSGRRTAVLAGLFVATSVTLTWAVVRPEVRAGARAAVALAATAAGMRVRLDRPVTEPALPTPPPTPSSTGATPIVSPPATHLPPRPAPASSRGRPPDLATSPYEPKR